MESCLNLVNLMKFEPLICWLYARPNEQSLLNFEYEQLQIKQRHFVMFRFGKCRGPRNFCNSHLYLKCTCKGWVLSCLLIIRPMNCIKELNLAIHCYPSYFNMQVILKHYLNRAPHPMFVPSKLTKLLKCKVALAQNWIS